METSTARRNLCIATVMKIYEKCKDNNSNIEKREKPVSGEYQQEKASAVREKGKVERGLHERRTGGFVEVITVDEKNGK